MRSLRLLILITSVTVNFYGQTIIPIDNFEDGDLIANNWANWRVFCYPQNNDGVIQVFKNDQDGASNKAVHAKIYNGTGSGGWINSAIMYKFSGLSGLDIHKYAQLRFKAKGSAYPLEVRLEAQPVTDYSYFRGTTPAMTSTWQQFTISLSASGLPSPGWGATGNGTVKLDSCLKHAYAFDFNIIAPTGSTTDIWIDDVEFVTDPAYVDPTPPILPTGLKQAAQAANIELGFALSPDYIGDSLYLKLIRQNATSITSEWGPVMAEIKKYPDRYDFSMGDATIKWAYNNNIKVKGEHLIWYLSDPDWLQPANYTAAQADSLMQHFITTTINYYKTNYPGTITHWSVVNEAIDDNTCSYRNNYWYGKLGKDYIAKAFTYARAADPTIKLYYNDYGADGAGLGSASRKADSLYNIIKRFKQQGVPIDGVGLQMHVSLQNFPGKAAILSQMNRLGALGLEVYVTEIDVAINEDLTGPSTLKYQQQAQVYCDVLQACIESPYCRDYTIWGITDRYSWYEQFFKKTDWPLITDFNYQPKPAWNCLLSTLNTTTDINNEKENLRVITLYPNPATNKITVELQQAEVLNASLFNMLGEELMHLQLNKGTNEINISSLTKGMYFLQFSDGKKGMQAEKFIVE